MKQRWVHAKYHQQVKSKGHGGQNTGLEGFQPILLDHDSGQAGSFPCQQIVYSQAQDVSLSPFTIGPSGQSCLRVASNIPLTPALKKGLLGKSTGYDEQSRGVLLH